MYICIYKLYGDESALSLFNAHRNCTNVSRSGVRFLWITFLSEALIHDLISRVHVLASRIRRASKASKSLTRCTLELTNAECGLLSVADTESRRLDNERLSAIREEYYVQHHHWLASQWCSRKHSLASQMPFTTNFDIRSSGRRKFRPHCPTYRRGRSRELVQRSRALCT
jgi:hypothetical protein